jgi:glycosyltransferase involved in cell wall biosynthesis
LSEVLCLLVTDDYLPHIGGSRVYYHKVASILAPALAVLTRERSGAREFDAAAGYSIQRVPLPGAAFPAKSTAGELADAAYLAARAGGALPEGACYLAGEVSPSGFAVAAAALVRRVPFGVVLHDEPLMGAGPVEAALRRRLLKRARAIVAASKYAEGRAREIMGGAAEIILAPPGVDLSVFTPGAPDPPTLMRYGVERGRYLLCVGRLVAYKNISAVIEALAALGDRAVKLVVAGEGPERGTLERLAVQFGVAESVMFAGHVVEEDLVQLYRGALAYVFPSRPAHGRPHEGTGMAGLEAAACGGLVIASTATSASDFVEDGRTGILFDPLENGALMRAIEAVVARREMRGSIARAGMERVRGEFSWERTAAAVRGAIEVIRRGGPRLP